MAWDHEVFGDDDKNSFSGFSGGYTKDSDVSQSQIESAYQAGQQTGNNSGYSDTQTVSGGGNYNGGNSNYSGSDYTNSDKSSGDYSSNWNHFDQVNAVIEASDNYAGYKESGNGSSLNALNAANLGFDITTTGYSDNDIRDMAATIYGEAGNQSYDGMLAVGNVIKNRASLANASISDVVYGAARANNGRVYGQFSVYNDQSGYNRIQRAAAANTPKWQDALRATADVLTGRVQDNTGGATHYYNPSIANPSWSNAGSHTTTIGDHTFRKMDERQTANVVNAAANSRYRFSDINLSNDALKLDDAIQVATAADEQRQEVAKSDKTGISVMEGLGMIQEDELQDPTRMPMPGPRDQMPQYVLDMPVKVAGGTVPLGSLTTSFKGLQNVGGQAFTGGFNDPNTTKALGIIANALGNNFVRVTAQNDPFHQVYRPNSQHTNGSKGDFTAASYKDAMRDGVKALENQGLVNGRDFVMRHEGVGFKGSTAPHIDVKITETGRAKIAALDFSPMPDELASLPRERDDFVATAQQEGTLAEALEAAKDRVAYAAETESSRANAAIEGVMGVGVNPSIPAAAVVDLTGNEQEVNTNRFASKYLGDEPMWDARGAEAEIAQDEKMWDARGAEAEIAEATPMWNARGAEAEEIQTAQAYTPDFDETFHQAELAQLRAVNMNAAVPRKVETVKINPDGSIKQQEQVASTAQDDNWSSRFMAAYLGDAKNTSIEEYTGTRLTLNDPDPQKTAAMGGTNEFVSGDSLPTRHEVQTVRITPEDVPSLQEQPELSVAQLEAIDDRVEAGHGVQFSENVPNLDIADAKREKEPPEATVEDIQGQPEPPQVAEVRRPQADTEGRGWVDPDKTDWVNPDLLAKASTQNDGWASRFLNKYLNIDLRNSTGMGVSDEGRETSNLEDRIQVAQTTNTGEAEEEEVIYPAWYWQEVNREKQFPTPQEKWWNRA